MMNSKLTNFNVDGIDFKVAMDIDSLISNLKGHFNEWDEDHFTKVWSMNEGEVNKEDYDKDLKETIETLEEVRDDQDMLDVFLEEGIRGIRKKKNGEFWKNSYNVIKQLDNVSNYLSDFTNAWSVLQLNLRSIDGLNCELVVQNRTVTN